MTATSFIPARLIMPEVAYEALVILPVFIMGQLPQTLIQQMLDLYPDVNKFRLVVPGGKVMEFERQQPPAEKKKADEKAKSSGGVILQA